MDQLDTVMNAFDTIGRELDAPALEPDPGRDDWEPQVERLGELRQQLEDEVLAGLDEACEILAEESPDAATNLRSNVAFLVAELAAAHHAAGRADIGAALLTKSLAAGPGDAVRTELEAAAREPDAFVVLTLGRWHHRSGDFTAGDRVLGAAKRGVSEAALRDAFEKCLTSPRPLSGGAPALFRLNGFGFGLYGERDPRPDGSHVATYCVSALFIPVLALSAYRVQSHGGGSYTFFTKERLSTFAKGWNWALVAAVVLGIGWISLQSYLDSPERLARIALEEAQAVEAAGEAAAAADAYQHLLDEHTRPSDVLGEAATGLVRVLVSGVETPMTPAGVDEAARIARRYRDLPDRARGGASASLLARDLGRWADEVGDGDEPSRLAALRLVRLAMDIAQGPDRDALSERASVLHIGLAESLRADWPLEALHHYVLADTQESMTAAGAIVAELGPSLVADADADVRTWEPRGESAATEHVRELRAELAEWQGDVRRSNALEEGDAEALALLHTERPRDQEVAVALADAKRGVGEFAEALTILRSYGEPGQLTSVAQRTLASCLADAGELEEADALLERHVASRLPSFQEAQRAYDSASRARAEGLISRARAGLEPALNRQLETVYDDARAGEIFDAWLRDQLEADASLNQLREAYTSQGEVVPAVLSLGTLKLRRAHAASGDERQRLLNEAERLFLAIRQEAEGVPAFHLSLGQVYHRLGRTDEGEAELRSLLDTGELPMALQVAHTYRELGLMARAREVAQATYESPGGGEAGESARGGCAHLMALMASTLEDEEMWLRRAPQESATVQTSLLRLRARRAFRERNLPEADRLYGEVAERYEAEGETSAAFNNAALAIQSRYLCSGNPVLLDDAVARMRHGLALSPDNAVLIGNFADVETYRATVRVLDGFVRTRTLRLGGAEAGALIDWLREGPRGAEVSSALRADPNHRHGRDLSRQEQVLAPQSPRGWNREWSWLVAEQDAEALSALLGRLRAVEGIDVSDQDEARGRERTEAQEARRRAEIDAGVGDAEAVVAAARRTRHAPTIAAALQLHATTLSGRALENASAADARAAVAVAREALGVWDGFGSAMLPWALNVQALLEGCESLPGLREAYDARHRELEPNLLMYVAAQGDAAVAEALRESPLLDESATLRSGVGADDHGITDLVLASLADHPGLRAASEGTRTRPSTRSSLEIRGVLDPNGPETELRRTILEP